MQARHQHWAMTVAAVAAALAMTAGCSGGAGSPERTRALVSGATIGSAPTAPAAATSPSTTPAPGLSVIAVPAPPAGLPQTRARPSARTSVFHAEMTDLWTGIISDHPSAALRAFFPLSAYQQVKAVADPTADWHTRLVAEFRLDLRAAHRYVGRGARLTRVVVPSSYSQWIVPGVCDNKTGYWHVPGARLVYRLHGELRSIGIASLISWRGRWYVVHFGAVLRRTAGGVVDTPAAGTGTPGPPGGC